MISNYCSLIVTRLSLKCSAWKGFIKFATKTNFKQNFRSEKCFVSENNFQKKFRSEKFWSQKKFSLKKFLFKNSFGTNQIFGLKILGPKKFQIWKRNWGSKKFLKKKFKAKINFGPEIFF